MKRILFAMGLLFAAVLPTTGADPRTKPLVYGLKNPTGVLTTTDGKIYVTADADKDGGVFAVADGKAVLLAGGIEQPRGVVAFQTNLFVAAKDRVWRVEPTGKATVFAAPEAFRFRPQAFQGIAVDEAGALYVIDAGKDGGAVYRIDPKGAVTLVDTQPIKEFRTPSAVAMDGLSHLLIADGSGRLLRLKIADGSTSLIADGLGEPSGLAWDYFGRLYVADRKGGRLLVFPRPGEKPVVAAADLPGLAAIGLGPASKSILAVDSRAGTLTAVRASVPGQEVDETPLAVETAPAFTELEWTGWKPENDKGQIVPFRPIVLTHAGDTRNRIFVATEQGVIHSFPNDPKATKTQIFLDIQERVTYDDKQNEEGFLGLTFHPKFKDNGEFFVFYTVKKPALTNVLSRFRVRKDNPDVADPASEEEILRITRPYWNHDGGTICFGPDGYLYLALGDGGLAADPLENGQNLKTLLGKVLRLDVDHKDAGKNYAVPKDNPFVGKADAAPEIWCYGLRNIWRMAFDRKTGKLWAGDVGQNLYEEIDILTAGGNYGWNLREGLHPFGVKGVSERKDLIDPIWEYHHDVGKCIIGGHVYRGSRLPELEGSYLYGDYVAGKLWALRYDETKGRVVANRPIADRALPMLSFGEDEKGEVYFLTVAANGRGIHGFVKKP